MQELSQVITYIVEASDRDLGADCRDAFPDAEVSVSSNLVGGVEIAVFFLAALRPAKEILALILSFQAERTKRFSSSKIVIGQDGFQITGYGPEDLEHITALPIFRDTLGTSKD